MTGAKFKAFFKTRHGTKWAKGASLELKCSKSSCMRYAISMQIPQHIERKLGTLMRTPSPPLSTAKDSKR